MLGWTTAEILKDQPVMRETGDGTYLSNLSAKKPSFFALAPAPVLGFFPPAALPAKGLYTRKTRCEDVAVLDTGCCAAMSAALGTVGSLVRSGDAC